MYHVYTKIPDSIRSFNSNMAMDESHDAQSQKGYFTKISPLKISRFNSQYFNAILETEHKSYNVVAYVPEKHQLCQDAEKRNTPVKIRSFKYVQGRFGSDLDIQINKGTSIELLKSLEFKRGLEFNGPSPSTSYAKDLVPPPTTTNIADIDPNKTQVMVSTSQL